jgi:Ca-activated chloride channel homolog
MVKKSLLSLLLVMAIACMAGTAMADTSVAWLSPPDGSVYDVGTVVNPTGNASAMDAIGGAGLDLALVIDESGSMYGGGLAAAKTAAISLVNNLPQDTTSVAVIGFDSYSHTYRLLTALNPDKNMVIAAINSIAAGGGTNIGAGVQAGINALTAGHTAGRTMMQVVLSDGYGSYSGQAATGYNNSGIITHTVGIPGHNATLMAQVASDGHGVYTNVSNLSQLEGIFNGTGGNLVGIDHVDIELPDGTVLGSIGIDGLGNFTLPDWAIQTGAQTFIATAYGTDGSSAQATLTLNGRADNNQPVPEPATMLLLSTGLLGLTGIRRKFQKK